MLVRFECGCVGFSEVSQGIGRTLIIEACDSPDGNLTVFYPKSGKKYSLKPYLNLSEEEEQHYVDRLASLIRGGYDLRAVKALLKPRDSDYR